jgi:predicted transcriptional regulator
METRQLARLLGALCFEERLEIIGALITPGHDGLSTQQMAEMTGLPHSSIPIHVDYMESTGMVSLRYTSSGKVYSADLDLLEKLFNFMNQNYGAGMRLMHRAQAERADATGAMLD